MAPAAPAIYLWVGDLFLRDKQYRSFLEDLASRIPGEIFSQSCRLSEASLEKNLAESRTLPFYAAAQVFRLQEAEELKEKTKELLTSYFENPPERTFLIFESVGLEKGSFLAELVGKYGKVQVLEAEEKRAAADRLVREKLRRAGKTVSPDAWARIEEQAGQTPVFLEILVDQLILSAGEQKEITEVMLERFEQDWEKVDAFRLIDALAAKKTGRALIFLKKLADTDADFIALLGLLHWQFKRLWQGRVLLDEGAPEAAILRKCRVNSPRQAPFFMKQLKVFSRKKLESCLEGLFQLDWKMKTGRTEDGAGLEAWVVETAGS